MLNKKKLAIISSYNESCGNASYTKALQATLAEHFDVTIIPLYTDLLRRGPSKVVSSHLKKITQEVQSFDCVNIQFEAGIFATSHSKAVERFFKIAPACKNLVVTMHRIDYHIKHPLLYPLQSFLNNNLSFKDVYKKAKRNLGNNRDSHAHYKAIAFCKKHSIPIVVHTQREASYVKMLFNYDLVFDHPLCFYNQDYIHSLSENYSRETFCKDFGLSTDKIHLGIFGLISSYKGYETAIRALRFLPENYTLIIFGKQHPLSIEPHQVINQYLEKLIKLIISLKLENRVKFLDASEEEDFLKAFLQCDFNLLPYLEVNQGGSGIAALSLETNSRAIFSQNKAFLELQKYAPSSFPTFSIGNYLELADAIQSYKTSAYIEKRKTYHQHYNPRTNAIFYKRIFLDNWKAEPRTTQCPETSLSVAY